MYAHELYEQNKPRVVVTYPGRFQPFHQGHAGVFAQLQKKFGAENVYILTSNDTSSAKSPFNFADKYQLITAAGIPGNHIVETNKMYILPEGFDPANTVFITAVGGPDADRLSPDSVLKKDNAKTGKRAGDPSYYKTWGSDKNPLTADQHGYVVVIPEIKKAITIKGKSYDVSHGTECRNLWNHIRNDAKARQEFLTQMYVRPSAEIAAIYDKIPETTAEDIDPVSTDSASPIPGKLEEQYNTGKQNKDVNLDQILVKLCEMVIEGQKSDKDYGMVAAAVIDNDGHTVFGINTPTDDGRRTHAEHVAMQNYESTYGELPEGSTIVTTLSPCSEPMDERDGPSCTDLINRTDCHKVYAGYKDPTQDYGFKSWHLEITKNKQIQELCKKFADTFLKKRTDENFADGKAKGKSRPGRVKRAGASCSGSVTSLRQKAKVGGEKGKMYHWCANMKAGKAKNESTDHSISSTDMDDLIDKFLPVAAKELKLDKLPHIELQPHLTAHGGQATFGRFVDAEVKIYLGIADRHPVDILRTLAHELVHFKQYLDGKMYHGAGETGSPIENEANAVAGVIMRHFNLKYPDAIDSKPLEL